MSENETADAVDREQVLAETIATVIRILEGMGCANASERSVVTAPALFDQPVLVEPRRFGQLAGQLAVGLRFVGYPFEDVAFLTVRQLGEMYVRDSFPALPTTPLAAEQSDLQLVPLRRGRASAMKELPICFVLGAPRSGTTLLRAMLDLHTDLWAPGELHLATFETMADRAREIGPILRYMPIPEVATRCNEPIAELARRFRGWELDATPTTSVYEHLHDADPNVSMVDKSPPYCMRRETLAWIGEHFPNARFVHIIRSPHDVIRSYVRMQLYRGDWRLFASGLNPHHAAEAVWLACNTNAERFLGSLPSDRSCSIRYEDLTADPAGCLGTICALLGKDLQPGMVDPYAKSGAIAQGAGDLHVNLLSKVEKRTPVEPFFALGDRSRELGARYAY